MHVVRVGWLILVVVLAGASCGTAEPEARKTEAPETEAPETEAPETEAPVRASATAGGCGRTPILLGELPDWAGGAGVPVPVRFVMSHEGNLVGVLFGDRLRVPPPPGGPNNKILWIAREPRNGKDLRLTLRPEGGGTATTLTEQADSGPGEIYPSIVDVPAPGCWDVVAEWDTHRATLELPYERG